MGSEENKAQGYISLFRSLKQWGWYKEPLTCHLFIHCLLSANHKDKVYKGVLVKKGSFLTSRKILADETGMSERNVRTALTRLKTTKELTVEKSQKGTIITVNNFSMYQETTKKMTTKRPSSDQAMTTNNNDNNENKEVVVENNNYSSDFMDFWKVYKRKGYIDDVYSYWQSMNVTPELKKAIVYGAKKYCESISDKRAMVFPRTFLKNRMWTDYPLPKQEDDMIAWLESKGYVKDDDGCE